ncbi:hypothetical protein D3C86_1511960 [compost metagenome]
MASESYQGSDSLPAAVTQSPKRTFTTPVAASTVPRTLAPEIKPARSAVTLIVPPLSLVARSCSVPGAMGATGVRNTTYSTGWPLSAVSRLFTVTVLDAEAGHESRLAVFVA